ncbi:MAG TPA: right-handed parallel beta-helix repeat-containing protein, partial [Bryobacteraceae bacterium]|nr:right-handed parallel beta-helix repeat-containing protein [Bryobacteraceae bacterium]
QNIYQCTVPVDATGFCSVWENDVRLFRAASMADLEATAGRYLPAADPDAAGDVTLYVHASDGANPATNGKRYEYARRNYGLFTDHSQCKVTGIHTRRNLGNNGSLEVGPSCTVVDCLASEGTKHNLLVHGNCTVIGCEVADSYYSGESKVLAVWNADSPDGESVTFVNCYAHDEFEGTAVGYYGHRNVSGSFGRITLRGCRAENVQAAFPAVGECREVVIEDCDLWVVTCAVDTTIRNSTIRGIFRCLNTVGGPVVTVRNCRIVATQTALEGADSVVYAPYPGATLDLQDSIVEGSLKDGPDLMVNGIWMNGADSRLTSLRNTFVNLAHFYMLDSEGYSVTSDNNVFQGPILASSFRLPGWQWKTLAQWREITGQDLHSTP